MSCVEKTNEGAMFPLYYDLDCLIMISSCLFVIIYDALVVTRLKTCVVSHQVTKSNTNPDDLGGLANQLTNEFGNLADEAKYAAVTAENDEVKTK